MRIVHGGERVVKTTITEGGVTFLNFPAKTCACGETGLMYEGSWLGVAETLSKRIGKVVTGVAVTVDWDKLNPSLVDQLREEYFEDFQLYLQQHPRRPRVSGLTGEEAEQRLLDALFPPDGEPEVSCETLVATR